MKIEITNVGVTINDRLYRAGDTFEVEDEKLKELAVEVETLRHRAEGSMCDLITQAAAPMKDYDDLAPPDFLGVFGRHNTDMARLRVARMQFMARVFEVYGQWVPIETFENRIVIQRQTQNLGTMRTMLAAVLSSMPTALVSDISFMLAIAHRLFDDAVVHQAEDADSPPYWMTGTPSKVSERLMGLESGPLQRIGRHYLPMKSGTVGGAAIIKRDDKVVMYPLATILADVMPKQRGTDSVLIVVQTSPEDERATLSVMRCKSKMGVVVAIDGIGAAAPNTTTDPKHPIMVEMAAHAEKIFRAIDVDGEEKADVDTPAAPAEE